MSNHYAEIYVSKPSVLQLQIMNKVAKEVSTKKFCKLGMGLN